MNYDNIMVYLERLRQFCFMDGENLLRVPIDGDWNMRHMEESLSEALDTIFDYQKVAEQAGQLIEKYETPKSAIRRGDGDFNAWQCPECHSFVSAGNEHCRWCGKKLGWNWESKGRCRNNHSTRKRSERKDGKVEKYRNHCPHPGGEGAGLQADDSPLRGRDPDGKKDKNI